MCNKTSKDMEYEVEEIIDHRKILGVLEFQIKWKGFPHSQNTWEPEENLINSKKMLKDYKIEQDLEEIEAKLPTKKITVNANVSNNTTPIKRATRGKLKDSEQINKIVKNFKRKMIISKSSASPSKEESASPEKIFVKPKKTDVEKDTNTEYEIEDIIQVKQIKGKALYEIKWKGYTSDHNTWEPEENLGHASKLLLKFKGQQEKKLKQEKEEKEEEFDEEVDQNIKKSSKKLRKLKFKEKNAKNIRKITGLKVNEDNEMEYLVNDEWILQKKVKKEDLHDLQKVQAGFEEYLKNFQK